MPHHQVVVVGGGVIGLMTALELVRAGCSTAVVELTTTGRESSWAGGGILSPLYPWRYADAVNALCRWSQFTYPRLIEDLRVATAVDAEWTQSGLIVLNGNHAAAMTWLQSSGVRCRAVKNGDLLDLEPRVASSGEAALWLPDIAQVRNPRLLKALRTHLEQLHVRFYEHTQVYGLVVRGDSLRGVETSRGIIEVEQCVITAGAWSSKLLEKMGITLSHRPMKGQMILLRARPQTVRHIILSGDCYLIPRRDGSVLVGSTVEDSGFDYTLTQVARSALRSFAAEIFPMLGKAEIGGHWSGLRPGSDEGVPYIGESPHVMGLYVNTGHFRNGIVMAPGSARLLADLMLSRPPIVDPAPYALP